jgi:glycosyltransferase involved in cell wall biosynthesis
MTQKVPRVSICIPTYNRVETVGLAIDSALAQTYDDLEVIVVDNASSDDIESLISNYSDPRLKFVKNSENLGIFGNFNRCIEVSKGEFLHILHSDDHIDPGFTEACVSFFDGHPKVVLTFTKAIVNSPDSTHEVKFADTDRVIHAPEGFQKIFRDGNFIICPSVMTRRNIYEKIGKYSLEYPFASDFYQWLKVLKVFDIGYVSNATVFYRQGWNQSETYKLKISNPLGYLDELKIFTQIISDLNEDYWRFAREINCSLYTYINECFIKIFEREANIKLFSPTMFLGYAVASWALITTSSMGESIRKGRVMLLILFVGSILVFPPIHKLAKKILEMRKKFIS